MQFWKSSLLFLASLSTAAAQKCWRDTECTGPLKPAFAGPWDKNVYSPSSRTMSPKSQFRPDDISNVTPYSSPSTIHGNGSAIVFDFGKEVGGIVTVQYSTTGKAGQLGLAFTEALNWVGLASDSSNGAFKHGIGDQSCDDGAIYDTFATHGEHSYTMDLKYLRGGFRYLTLFLFTEDDNTTLTFGDVSLEIGFEPTWSNLQAYQGYFHSSDEMLNKIWYSGAYTLQTNAVPINTGRQVPTLHEGWANNGTLSNGTTVIVDGAKRDRAVWPGDMGIAVPSTFVSTGALESVMYALQTMYDHQNSDGSFPEAGPPLLQQGSDTYHCWTMIGTYNYVLYTNDTEFLAANWASYQRAMDYVYGKVLQPLGLLNVTGTRDWARVATGGNNTEANMILYKTLMTGSELASWLGQTTLSSTYSSRAFALAESIKKYTFDQSYGAFKDNNTATDLHPQDANSMALLFGVVPNSSHTAQTISDRLTRNWTPIGAETPELPNNISPFISSFEIQAHFTVGNAARALELIRRTWGWYLNNPNGTESTVIEGYLTNGSFAYRNYRGYNYDASYVSHSHGWSSGPTSALTNYVLGLSVTDRAGSAYKLAPQFGHLTSVEGGFTTKLGKFQAKWIIAGNGRSYSGQWTTPHGTVGEIVLPSLAAGRKGQVFCDGKRRGSIKAHQPFSMTVASGGTHRVEVRSVS